MSLCTTCYDVFTRIDENPSAFRRDETPPFQPGQIPTTRHPRLMHLSWDSFCNSIDQNCPICWTVWRELRSSPIASCRGETHQDFFTWLWVAQGELLHIMVFLSAKDKKIVYLRVFRTTKERFKAEARFLEGGLFSEATITTVKNWLDQCPEAHRKCKSRKQLNPTPGTVPTRLLDTHGSQAKTWSLIETSHTIPASSDYVALSHRWSKDTLKLEIANRSQYLTPQLNDILPRTYQDVFALCRALDIRYIWIDSLCIIQDSVEDFKREVATMMSVYMNAVCTISICWEYPNAGLSFYRKPNTVLRWSETYTKDKATTGPKSHAFVRNFLDWNRAVDSAPVNTRGWVFQERLLSPRILYLGNDVLFWECDQFLTSEIAPGRPLFSRTNIAAKPHNLARKWPHLVSVFMHKDLSHETDRLFAISGIAQLFAQRTSETFLAGLRKTSWAHDLLWHPKPFLPSHNRSTIGPFPSWSWAACPAPLGWPTSEAMLRSKMTATRSETTSEDETLEAASDDEVLEAASDDEVLEAASDNEVLEAASDNEVLEAASDDGDDSKVHTLAHLSTRSLEAFRCDIYGKPGSISLDMSCFLIPAQYEEFDDETAASNAHTEWLQHPHNPQYARVASDGFLFSTSHHRRGPSLITLPIRERNSECTDFSPSCFVLPLLDESGHYIILPGEERRDDNRGYYAFFDLHALIVQQRPRNPADVEETEQIGVKEYVRIGTLTVTLKAYYRDSSVWLNEYQAYRGIINGMWEQMRMHDSDASGPVGADEYMGFEKGLRKFVRARNDELSHIVGGKMSEHQANVTVQVNWATIRLV